MSRVDYRNGTTIVTGASSGIGAEFARALAARGSDLVLVARRADRLEALAAEVRDAHRVRAWPVPLDLALPAAGDRLAGEVDALGLEVTSVVNNAGFGNAGPFHDQDRERVRSEVAVDVSSVVDVSHAFIGRLRAAGTGVLVNVASMAAYQPFPRMAVYAASKAFVLHFTEALWHESRGSGLRVLAVSPGATRTGFNDAAGADTTRGAAVVETPAQVVRTALRALDSRTPPPSVVSGRLNRLAAASVRLLPRRQSVVIAASFTRGLEA